MTAYCNVAWRLTHALVQHARYRLDYLPAAIGRGSILAIQVSYIEHAPQTAVIFARTR